MRKPFCRSTVIFWMLLPLAFVPLLVPTWWPRTWSSIDIGWPWHYGWQFIDRTASGIPRIESLVAFFADFFIGLALVLGLWLLLSWLLGMGEEAQPAQQPFAQNNSRTAGIKWAGRILACIAALSALIIVLWQAVPFQRCVLLVNHIEFIGWGSYWDGGSRSFTFSLPGWRTMVVLAPHRNEAFGGNPDFQEIWLGPDEETKRQVCLKPGSALEAHLLTLVRTASVNQEPSSTNRFWRPTLYELKWLAERIQDRKSKW